MAPRLELQALLESFTPNVYFQPPGNLDIEYPCIIYNRDGSSLEHADNKPYSISKRYQVTVIDRSADSVLPDKVESLPKCRFDRWFAADNLNHYVFTLFF